MALVFFVSPPFSSNAAKRLEAASRNSPAFKYGESRNEGVAILQLGLIALGESNITIPDGPTGNYMQQTAAAVRAFQARRGLVVDGVAGQQTVTRLDSDLDKLTDRVLEKLDRDIPKVAYYQYSERNRILDELKQEMRRFSHGNTVGIAIADDLLILVVIIFFFILIWLSAPATQKELRRLMRELIEEFNQRGEVAQEKLRDLKAKVERFINEVREVKTGCEQEVLLNNPEKHAECLRKFGLRLTAAHHKLTRTLRELFTVIFDQFGRGRFRFPPGTRVKALSEAFQEYMDAVNDFLSCLECPEIPLPVFPDHPNFP
jgi:ElaB/YqjD/DUF883 family membrane-anchored ribosome-binding protein